MDKIWIKQDIKELDSGYFDGEINTIISKLQKLSNQKKQEGWREIRIHHDASYDYTTHTLAGERLETESEAKIRIKKEKREKEQKRQKEKKKEEAERKQYLELKKKFE